MNSNLLEMAEFFADSWGTKTLSHFREEALLEDNGIRFQSIREDKGQRFFLIVCVTSEEKISVLESLLNPIADGPSPDWNTVTLSEIVRCTASGNGASFEDLRNDSGARVALVLCATAPEKIKILETIFDL